LISVISSEILLGHSGYQITGMERKTGVVRIAAQHAGPRSCPHGGGAGLRNKGSYLRRVRHENWGLWRVVLLLRGRKCSAGTAAATAANVFPASNPASAPANPSRR